MKPTFSPLRLCDSSVSHHHFLQPFIKNLCFWPLIRSSYSAKTLNRDMYGCCLFHIRSGKRRIAVYQLCRDMSIEQYNISSFFQAICPSVKAGGKICINMQINVRRGDMTKWHIYSALKEKIKAGILPHLCLCCLQGIIRWLMPTCSPASLLLTDLNPSNIQLFFNYFFYENNNLSSEFQSFAVIHAFLESTKSRLMSWVAGSNPVSVGWRGGTLWTGRQSAAGLHTAMHTKGQIRDIT